MCICNNNTNVYSTVIDWTRSLNTENKDLAYKSLEKWRKLSNKASTNALIRTLNSMKKQSIAQQLQRTVIVTWPDVSSVSQSRDQMLTAHSYSHVTGCQCCHRNSYQLFLNLQKRKFRNVIEKKSIIPQIIELHI